MQTQLTDGPPPGRSSVEKRSRVRAFFSLGFGSRELVLLVVGAGIFVLAMPPHGISPLGPLVLAPLLAVLRDKTPRVAISGGFVFGLLAYIGGLPWFADLFGVFAIGFWSLLALFCAAFAGLFALLARWWGYRVALYFSPLAWLAIDFFRCEQWPLAFGWLSLGYSQQHPLLLPAASLVGVYGLTALLAASAAAIVALFTLRDRASAIYAAGVLIVFGALIGLGQLALPAPSSANRTVRFRLVQVEGNLTRGLQLAAAKGLRPDTVVVLPEYATLDSPLQQPAIRERLARFARRHRVYLIIGCVEFTAKVGDMRHYNNIALLFGPSGRVLGKYQKHHPVPLFNEGEPGRGYPVFRTPLGALGTAICFDMDFEDVARRSADNGAELLVAPTADLRTWGRVQHLQHAAMIPFRAVESGRAVLRPAGSGVTQVSDARGRVLHTLGVGKVGIVDAVAARRSGTTPYRRIGYLLPWLAQVATLVLFGLGWWRQRRSVGKGLTGWRP
jgi:apolipoprotein N-acyltransferase